MNPALFEGRNAFADHAKIISRPVFVGADDREPLITIAIPTFRRFELLLEAVRSGLTQRFDRPIEIIVVDNDPSSENAIRLLDHLPELRRANFRYFVNAENIGMFGNWNRCIELGRGEWHTLLNDDDLLDPDFCTRMFAAFDAEPDFDALICRKRTLDQRQGAAAATTQGKGDVIMAALRLAYLEARFHGKVVRHLPPSKFFFGSLVGNTVGLVARKGRLLSIGGYHSEDYPSADQFFMTRLAHHYRLGEVRHILASIRIAENESARPEVIRGFILRNQQLRERMAGVAVPRWWLRFSALTVARHRTMLRASFGGEVSDKEIHADLGLPVVPDRKHLFYAICAVLGVL